MTAPPLLDAITAIDLGELVEVESPSRRRARRQEDLGALGTLSKAITGSGERTRLRLQGIDTHTQQRKYQEKQQQQR